MASEDSRNFPTAQALSIGKFLLAPPAVKSDYSAMAGVDQIRRTLREALAGAGETAIGVAKELEIERNYIRDFLEGKKDSLKINVAVSLSERYGILLKDLTPTKDRPIAIRKGVRPHLYLAEHMEAKGLDDRAVAGRMDGVSQEAVEKWRSDPSKLQDWQVAAFVQALGFEDEAALSRPPVPARRIQRRPKAVRKRA